MYQGSQLALTMEEVLQVNQMTVFDLVDTAFYEIDFSFFPKLAQLFVENNENWSDIASKVGLVSTLIYLSTKIHDSVRDSIPTTEVSLRGSLQMPILIGDLLYGRFLDFLQLYHLDAQLYYYTDYLKRYNSILANQLHDKQLDESIYDKTAISLLTDATVMVLAECMKFRVDENTQQKARLYLEEALENRKKSRVHSIREVKSLLSNLS